MFDATIADGLPGVLLAPEQASALDVGGGTEAAVLVPLHVRPDRSLAAVFTERRGDLRRHAGEISFPGGRRDPSDPDLLSTAVREVREEIGLAPDAIEVLGALQPTPTIVTGFAVYPFVARITPPSVWLPNVAEVAQVIELPLDELLAGYGRRRLVRRGLAFRTDTYLAEGHLIWGATARILSDLFDRFTLVSR